MTLIHWSDILTIFSLCIFFFHLWCLPLTLRQRSGVCAESGPRWRLPQSQTGIHGQEHGGTKCCNGGTEGLWQWNHFTTFSQQVLYIFAYTRGPILMFSIAFICVNRHEMSILTRNVTRNCSQTSTKEAVH